MFWFAKTILNKNQNHMTKFPDFFELHPPDSLRKLYSWGVYILPFSTFFSGVFCKSAIDNTIIWLLIILQHTFHNLIQESILKKIFFVKIQNKSAKYKIDTKCKILKISKIPFFDKSWIFSFSYFFLKYAFSYVFVFIVSKVLLDNANKNEI